MLIKKSGWAIIGMAVMALSQWAAIVIIARVFGASVLGDYSLALAIINPVFALGSLQLRAHIATSGGDDHLLGRYLGTRLVIGSCLCVTLPMVVYSITKQGILPAIVTLLCLLKFLDYIFDLSYGVYQRHGEIFPIARSQLYRAFIGMAVLWVVSLASGSLSRAISLQIAACTIILFRDMMRVRSFTGGFSPEINRGILNLIGRTWPMSVAVFFSSFSLNLPRYMVAEDFGSAGLGNFVPHLVLSSVMLMGAVGIVQAHTSRLNDFSRSGWASFRTGLMKLTAYFLLSGLTLTLLASVIGVPLLKYLFKNITIEARLLTVLTASGVFWGIGSMLDYGLVFMRLLKLRIFLYLLPLAGMGTLWNCFFRSKGLLEIAVVTLVGGMSYSLCCYAAVSYGGRTSTR